MAPHANPTPGGRPYGAKGRVTQGPRGTGLSECASWYAKAVCNPFGDFDELPCIPDYPAVPTYRVRTLTRGTFFTALATGIGFVSISPMNAARDVVGNVASIYFTGPGNAYAGTGFGVLPTVGVTGAARSGNPFTQADFAQPGIQGRLVGLGMRCRNITAVLNRGGLLLGAAIASDTNLDVYSGTQINQNSNVRVIPQGENPDWVYLCWRPWQEEDIGFFPGIGQSIAPDNNRCMGFLASVGAGLTISHSFEYEIVEFWEYQGASPATGATIPYSVAGHSDPVGLARVLEGAAVMPLDLSQKGWANETALAIVDAMGHSDSAAKTVEDLLGLAGIPLAAAGQLVKSFMSFLMV